MLLTFTQHMALFVLVFSCVKGFAVLIKGFYDNNKQTNNIQNPTTSTATTMNPSLRNSSSNWQQRPRRLLKSNPWLVRLIVVGLACMIYVFGYLHYHADFNNVDASRVKLIITNNNKELEKLDEVEEEKKPSDNVKQKDPPIPTTIPDVDTTTPTTSLIIFCYNRPQYLQRTLDSLYSRFGDMKNAFPSGVNLIISQDGSLPDVSNVIEAFGAKINREFDFKLSHWNHPQKTDFNTVEEQRFSGYFALSSHYEWGLTKVFESESVQRVIILEDDLELGVDFFTFFALGSKLLDTDSGLYAISSWNDHGTYSSDAGELYRSDFFPGLGWMLCRRIWEELKPKWPRAFWDDWMRDPKQRKDRQIIHPEVPRTITFGAVGASAGQFFDQYLKNMPLNKKFVNFLEMKSLSFALSREEFRRSLKTLVANAEPIQPNQAVLILQIKSLDEPLKKAKNYVVYYSSLSEYEAIANQLGIIADNKAGIPRGACDMIVPLRVPNSQTRVFIAMR